MASRRAPSIFDRFVRIAVPIGVRVALASVLVIAVDLPPANAQSTTRAEPTAQEKETARALMDKGDDLFGRQDYAGALKAYAGAHAIMHVPTTAIELGKTHAQLGHLVEARDAWMEAVRYPKAPNEPEVFTKARAEAAERAATLAERIPSIRVEVTGVPIGTEPRIAIDGVTIPSAASQLPMKVNPGKHHVVVSSDATYDASRDVEVVERQNVEVSIAVMARPESIAESRPRPLRTAGIITTAVGAAGLVAGGVFGILAANKQSDADCPNNICRDDASAETLKSANDWAVATNIALVTGGLVTAAGVTMWLLGAKDSRRTASTFVPFGSF